MKNHRSELDRFYRCTIRMDGLYYLAARHLGVNENTLSLFYALDGGAPLSQKQLAEEMLIPKTTVNSVVQEYVREGYLQLLPAPHGREKTVSLTPAGQAYARQLLRPIYAAEEEAMAATLSRFSPEFLLAAEDLTEQLYRSFHRHILSQKEH